MSAPLVITPGEPAGIGPDLCITLAQQPRLRPLLVIADGEMLQQRATELALPLQLERYQPGGNISCAARRLTILPQPIAVAVTPGRPNPANADSLLAALRRAINGSLSGEFAGLVTGPLQKGVICAAGYTFSGHTEYLAEQSGCERVVMMLATPGLRVALATTHLPLAKVPAAITQQRLEAVITILHRDLQQRFGIADPHILVAGLNPHAGEDGHLGDEERRIITPLLERLRATGMRLTGPLPADTLFLPARLATADAVLAMYHDQGLPVLKHLGFSRAVNITLGLPFIRTSVDHGTALELAGRGGIDGGSLDYAIEVAWQMVDGQIQ